MPQIMWPLAQLWIGEAGSSKQIVQFRKSPKSRGARDSTIWKGNGVAYLFYEFWQTILQTYMMLITNLET